ncbi:GUN4 domain-containing protein [Pseudanabaena sp. UWO310]|uniref:GUN4 domain-containing protein n=1 Tax=Pseudanabaena sp. UWO310 TaxID=2480795 RepID=UPI00115A5B35|nr:GUN4 domain-containing protein [Pseudanabaena sp. UWO310]TYQ31953.1 GUN4 domain-containing protein [Pseudanabaena sp. UWO310]
MDTKLTALKDKLFSGKEANQLPAIAELANLEADFGEEGLQILDEFIQARKAANTEVTWIDGKIHQVLLQSNLPKATELVQSHYANGVVTLKSEKAIDYQPIQILLAKQEFEEADRITSKKLCEAAGADALARGWLYFTEAKSIPISDLQTINQLWLVYSEGKFGFSVQRKIWLSLGKGWEKFWLKIGWKKDGSFTRYPKEFIWSLDAPRGHLPLSNQLRGNKTMQAIFSHPAW